MGKEPKSGTESTKRKFKFVSFKEKVDGIKIDPIRRVGKKITDYTDQNSYFITSFENWSELNLSADFTEFSSQCEQYCGSLPLIIHHQQEIFDLLISHIAHRNEHSLESLLDLITHFAHDLGPDFHPYFKKTLQAIMSLISSSDIEVVQWSFNSLAYLFKFLSRLLTTDLKPTYDEISPLLGEEYYKKQYVNRFAAESLSFLLRKCSRTSLKSIIKHIVDQLADKQSDKFTNSIVLLFVESIKSSGSSIHSKGPELLKFLLEEILFRAPDDYSSRLASRTLSQVLHHTQKEDAKPVYSTVLDIDYEKIPFDQLKVYVLLLVNLTGHRRGSRVSDWSQLFKTTIKILEIKKDSDPLSKESLILIITLAYSLMAYSDFPTRAKYFSDLLQSVFKISDTRCLLFCEIMFEKDSKLFFDYVFPYFRQFVLESSTFPDAERALFLVNLFRAQNSIDANPKLKIIFKAEMFANFEKIILEDLNDQKKSRDLCWKVFLLRYISVSNDVLQTIFKDLQEWSLNTDDESVAAIVLGELFSIMASSTMSPDEISNIYETIILGVGVLNSVNYLEGLNKLSSTLEENKCTLSSSAMEKTFAEISPFCRSPSQRIRRCSIEILSSIYRLSHRSISESISNILNTCSSVESLPREVANARNLQMHIRNLGVIYSTTVTDEPINSLVVNHMFGLLSERFQPAWQAALESIQESSKKAKDEIWEVISLLLEDKAFVAPIRASNTSSSRIASEGYSTCSNVTQLIDRMTDHYEKHQSPYASVVIALQSENDFYFDHTTQRALALKALESLTSIAEKHSAYLIPHFLWSLDGEESSESWAWKERLSLLRILSSFRDQQKLALATKLHDRYLYFLANRSIEVQKLSLKCLAAFRSTKLRKYTETFETLLDETQFKDALVNILNTSDDGVVIHEKDRDEVFPYIVRILFGRAQSGKSKHTQIFAIISSLQNLDQKYIRMFVQIAVDRLDCEGFIRINDRTAALSESAFSSAKSIEQSDIQTRRELGFMTLLESLVNILGSRLGTSVDLIMNALIFSMWYARTSSDANKSIRASCFKSLSVLIKSLPDFDWSSYFDVLFKVFIEPRLERFQQNNSQQPSSLMMFLRDVSGIPSFFRFLIYRDCVMVEKILDLPSIGAVKEASIDCLLDIVTNIMSFEGRSDPDVFAILSGVLVSRTLKQIPLLLERSLNPSSLEKVSQILVTLLEGNTSVDSAAQIALISASLKTLSKPGNEVRADIKATILRAFSKLISYANFDESYASETCKSLAPLFKVFRDCRARQELANVFLMLGRKFPKYSRVGNLVLQLNAYSAKRLDTLDFNQRLEAYAEINENIWGDLSGDEWIPLLYNMLYFIRDPDELALRTNSVYSLKRFVDCKVLHPSETVYLEILRVLILNEVRLGLRNGNELIRTQYVEILHHIVQKEACEEISDMSCLLFGGDEEADFFNNICHIQMHRRQRTINRLTTIAEQCQLSDNSISHYLMPILEHYLSVTQGYSHWLAEESIRAIGSLSKHLSWNQYRAILKRHVARLSRNEGPVKMNIRLIDAMASSAMDSYEEKSTDRISIPENAANGAVLLSQNFPKSEKLNAFVTSDLSPHLIKLLEKVDDNEEIILRVEIAIPLIKFMKLLQKEELEKRLPGILSKISQILRSKAQDVRDAARNALCKAASLLGSEYLVFIVRELKSVLRRGAQLHVLGYTVHTLLLELQKALKTGDVDDSSQLIGEIIMEDIFGVTGEEKDEEGYISKMREVKQQKSYDSGQLLAKWITLPHFSNLIDPVKKLLLYDTMNSKLERKIEELLRRYSLGLQENSECETRNVLVMCYEIFKGIEKVEADWEKQMRETEGESDVGRMKKLQAKEAEDFFTVELDSRNWKAKNVLHPENLHFVHKFVLDSLRAVFGKHDKLLTVENVTDFIYVARRGLTSSFESVEISAMRLLSLLINLPLPEIQDSLIFFGKKAVEFIEASTDTNSELCQASLKLLSVLIRQKSDFVVKEPVVSYILNRIQPDIEEPGKQGITFTFIKAVLSRKIVLNEVYDLMDHVAKAMVTNQTTVIRNACRSAYFMFLTDYPQGSARLSKQMAFLIANLEYPSEAGRLSVMELMHLLISKIDSEQLKDFFTSFFMGLVLTLVNDESSECREHAAALIKEIIKRSKQEELQTIEKLTISWISEGGPLCQGGMIVAGVLFAELGIKKNQQLFHISKTKIIEFLRSGKQKESGEGSDWKSIYASLQLFQKMTQLTPGSSEFEQIWPLVSENLLYPHSWVRLASCRLIGVLFNGWEKDYDSSNDNLQLIAAKLIRQMGAPGTSESLATQIVKNLVFISTKWEEASTIYMPNLEFKGKNEDQSEKLEEQLAVDWIVNRAAAILRDQSRPKETRVSKKAATQLTAALCQILSEQRVIALAEILIMAYYNYATSEDERDEELKSLTMEAMNLIQNKIGTTNFVRAYTAVQETVASRRQERKSKRAMEAVTEPEKFARKKLKKNYAKREKRRNAKDEYGQYHTKKKRAI